MIEFQQEKDRRIFLKRNLKIALETELNAEDQRVKQGKIPEPRRPLIERLFVRLLVKPDGKTPENH